MNSDARLSTVNRLVVTEIVTFPPEVDVTNASRIGASLVAAGRPGVSVIIADMTQTRFCDSAGVRQLALAHNRATENLAQLRVVTACATVLRILQLTGLDQMLDIRPSIDAALAGPWPRSSQDDRRVADDSAGSEPSRAAPGVRQRSDVH